MHSLSTSSRRSYWLRTLHQWHWISAALSLGGMMLFALTGLAMNNAEWIMTSPRISTQQLQVPHALLSALPKEPGRPRQPLPQPLTHWLNNALDLHMEQQLAEISAEEIYLSLPEPGADRWLAIDRHTGTLDYEYRSQGWIAYLNDLHKGRHTGALWRWFIDIFALACLVFSISGLVLMKMHASNRTSTWPLLGLGALLPLLLMILFVH